MINRYVTLEELMKQFDTKQMAVLVRFLTAFQSKRAYLPNELMNLCPEDHKLATREALIGARPMMVDAGFDFSLTEIERTLEVLDSPTTEVGCQ